MFSQILVSFGRQRRKIACALLALFLVLFVYRCAVESHTSGGLVHSMAVMADRRLQRWYDDAHVYHNICFTPPPSPSSSSPSSTSSSSSSSSQRSKWTFTFTVFQYKNTTADDDDATHQTNGDRQQRTYAAGTAGGQQSIANTANAQPECFSDGTRLRYCVKHSQTSSTSNSSSALHFSDQLAVIPLRSSHQEFFNFMNSQLLSLFGLVKWITQK